MSSMSTTANRRLYHKRLVLCLLLIMILVNFALRLPSDHSVPYGSDTFSTLDLSRSLDENGRATWVLSPLSYLGLFPMSYPFGGIFIFGEYHVLSDADWNMIPWIVDMVFTVLLVLAGFVFFRAFKMDDVLAVLMAGLMAMSPFFLFFTYGQASTRAFVIPLAILSITPLFWLNENLPKRFLFFISLAVVTILIHRSSYLILALLGLGGLVWTGCVASYARSVSARRLTFAVMVSIALVLFLWPFVPGLNGFFGSFTEFRTSYETAEWEFSTGALFEGSSSLVLVANLAANYVGSLGLAMLLIAFAPVALYPMSISSREKDAFLMAMFVVFAPSIWKAQYVQLLVLPFLYLIAGLAIQRRGRLRMLAKAISDSLRLGPHRKRLHIGVPSPVAIAAVVISFSLFSVVLFDHREDVVDPYSNEANWPTDSTVNLGIYIDAFEKTGTKAFVSDSSILDRRLRWFSEWNCSLTDPSSLLASGYLNVTSKDFIMGSEVRDDFVEYLSIFYRPELVFRLKLTVPNRALYSLSLEDLYGSRRIYFEEPAPENFYPRISTAQAGVSLVVEMESLGTSYRDQYSGSGVANVKFFQTIGQEAYEIFISDEFNVYLAAVPTS